MDLGGHIEYPWDGGEPRASEDPEPEDELSLVELTYDGFDRYLESTPQDQLEDQMEESPSMSDRQLQEPIQAHALEIRLPRSSLLNPRSQYEGWNPPLEVTSERAALGMLMDSLDQDPISTPGGFIEFELDSFSIYVNSKKYPWEFRPPHSLTARQSSGTLYFDGILSNGHTKHYVQRVPFSELPIGNYGPSRATVGGDIWIRSVRNESSDIYYRLKNPSVEYARFYEPFLWVADFGKHVVDYCGGMRANRRQVSLGNFKQAFIEWLDHVHHGSSAFHTWHAAHGSDDYRTSVMAYVDYLWKEVNGVLGYQAAASLQLFKEIKFLTQYEPAVRCMPNSDGIAPTIVTPYIYDCFAHMRLGRMLCPVEPGNDCELLNQPIPEGTKFEPMMLERWPKTQHVRHPSILQSQTHKDLILSIVPGDTISTPRDNEDTGTKWKREGAAGYVDDNRWFALVQKVHVDQKYGSRTFDVIWLYKPVDTPCCRMKYPWSNELFLSDHCSCAEGRISARVHENEVLAKHMVHWFGKPETCIGDYEFFIRQTYMVDYRRWVKLSEMHMWCNHIHAPPPAHTVGDTVLAVLAKDDKFAEVFEVVELPSEYERPYARLRRLQRRSDVDVGSKLARPNELVYTDHVVDVSVSWILGKCMVRFFLVDESIPVPYSRDGTANVFYITHRLEQRQDQQVCVPFQPHEFPPSLRQGFDPSQRMFPKLRGLDLFCGSGNFGRGLEEAGAVDMCWTNDIWDTAIHTYMANTPCNTRPFLGSVDDLLLSALEGNYSDEVPCPGEVDFIAGGSPCQGFSLLTENKACNSQVKNRSLVASFASFVDFYRPKYGILENVPSIVQGRHNRTEDVFSQLICAIVGMGYQTQVILGDSWAYGAPQSRSRVFLSFAAPDCDLPEAPRPSHSHYDGVKSRHLGTMSNGEPFVQRSFEPTAFKFVSAAEATADLPDILDGKADSCIAFPDHRLSIGFVPRLHEQCKLIPTQPHGMNFVKAWNEGRGVLTESERAWFPDGTRAGPLSKGWGRVHPHGVFSTITTCCSPTDARIGRALHWRENRPLSIMEARRAQGFPDDEVLIGSTTDQWKLVGNSVTRQMSLALGIQLRQAWLSTHEKSQAATGPGLARDYEIDISLADREATSSSHETSDSKETGVSHWSDTTASGSICEVVTGEAGSKKRPPAHEIGPDSRPPPKVQRLVHTTIATLQGDMTRYTPSLTSSGLLGSIGDPHEDSSTINGHPGSYRASTIPRKDKLKMPYSDEDDEEDIA
jgi:DNA (cytosine-5)-methyltransferase 1